MLKFKVHSLAEQYWDWMSYGGDETVTTKTFRSRKAAHRYLASLLGPGEKAIECDAKHDEQYLIHDRFYMICMDYKMPFLKKRLMWMWEGLWPIDLWHRGKTTPEDLFRESKRLRRFYWPIDDFLDSNGPSLSKIYKDWGSEDRKWSAHFTEWRDAYDAGYLRFTEDDRPYCVFDSKEV